MKKLLFQQRSSRFFLEKKQKKKRVERRKRFTRCKNNSANLCYVNLCRCRLTKWFPRFMRCSNRCALEKGDRLRPSFPQSNENKHHRAVPPTNTSGDISVQKNKKSTALQMPYVKRSGTRQTRIKYLCTHRKTMLQ